MQPKNGKMIAYKQNRILIPSIRFYIERLVVTAFSMLNYGSKFMAFSYICVLKQFKFKTGCISFVYKIFYNENRTVLRPGHSQHYAILQGITSIFFDVILLVSRVNTGINIQTLSSVHFFQFLKIEMLPIFQSQRKNTQGQQISPMTANLQHYLVLNTTKTNMNTITKDKIQDIRYLSCCFIKYWLPISPHSLRVFDKANCSVYNPFAHIHV